MNPPKIIDKLSVCVPARPNVFLGSEDLQLSSDLEASKSSPLPKKRRSKLGSAGLGPTRVKVETYLSVHQVRGDGKLSKGLQTRHGV